MKEIGEKIRNTRESMGISIEEASTDLKIKKEELLLIEEGNMEKFKDIFYLKNLIRDYAKYLGLNRDEIIDEFNEYLFDITSKISLEDIKLAPKYEEDKIKSPYTQIPSKNNKIKYIIISIILITLIISLLIIFNRPNDVPNIIG